MQRHVLLGAIAAALLGLVIAGVMTVHWYERGLEDAFCDGYQRSGSWYQPGLYDAIPKKATMGTSGPNLTIQVRGFMEREGIFDVSVEVWPDNRTTGWVHAQAGDDAGAFALEPPASFQSHIADLMAKHGLPPPPANLTSEYRCKGE